METVNRILQEKITARIAPNKAVLIFGARRVGKTVMMRKIVDNYSGRAVNHKKPQTAKQHCNSAVYQHVTQIQTEHKGSYLRLTKYKESVLLGVLEWC